MKLLRYSRNWLLAGMLALLPLNAMALDLNNSCYTFDNPYYNGGYGGQCTAFAWGRACETTGIYLQMTGSPYPSAKYWYLEGPVDTLNLNMGSVVQDNSIAVWAGDESNLYGHVAYVERVEGETVYFHEANVDTYNGSTFGGGYDGYEKSSSIENFESRGVGIGTILGYIYLTSIDIPAIYDFWKIADPIYADPDSDIWNPNFDAQYKIVNHGSEEINIQRLALAIHDADNAFLFDMLDPDTGQARYYDDFVLSPGESHHFVFSVAYFNNPGDYKVVAKAQFDNEWHDLDSLDFVVQQAVSTSEVCDDEIDNDGDGDVDCDDDDCDNDSVCSGITSLTSGEQVSDVAERHVWKKYKITASASDTRLQVDLTNLTTDLDLYVRQGSEPTLTSYDCRPYSGGAVAENCTMSNSGDNVWYISVYGYQAGSFDLEAVLSGSDSATELISGEMVSGAAEYHNWANYMITASSSDTQLQVDLSNLSVDMDLYVKQGAMPTLSSYDCRPYRAEAVAENCILSNSGDNVWYISVYGYRAGSFDLEAVLSGSTSTVTPLISGEQVVGSAGYNAWKKYKITASSSDIQLQVDLTGLSADLDLYVQQGAEPTLLSYLCRPYRSGTASESCTVANSGETDWYISVYGYQAGSFDLEVVLLGSDSLIALTSDEQVSDATGYRTWKQYKIIASSSDTQLQVDLSNLSADLDLYVKQGAVPTLSSYDCRPYRGGVMPERCTLSNSGETDWYISVYGYQAGSFDLEAVLSGSDSVTALTSGEQVSDATGYRIWKQYKIIASSSDTQLQVDLSNLSADLDLYVKQGTMPTLSSYDCRPYREGVMSERCTLSNSGETDWYISVYGYRAGSFDLEAVLSGGVSAGNLVFPFAERDDIWQICQGYNTPTISHTGNLIFSFDFAYGIGNLGATGCWGNEYGSEDKTVVAPGAGTVVWNGANDTDITCLKLQSTVSNGYGYQIASVKLGHMKLGSGRVAAGQDVDQGESLGKLCGPTGCPSVGGYAHTHMSVYSSVDCGGMSVPFGTAFGEGYDFRSNGAQHQWHGIEIPVQ